MRKYIIGKGYKIVTPLGTGGSVLILSQPTQCSGCGENMHAGQHVTRHHKKDDEWTDANHVFCQACYPFRYRTKRSDTYQTASKFPVEVDMKEYWI
jgi:hypothetical protein